MNTDNELLIKLDALISNWEDETVEFKEANNDYDKDKIGRYFSALSNEANLRNVQCGWLVFGVKEKGKIKYQGSDRYKVAEDNNVGFGEVETNKTPLDPQ